MGQAFDRDGNVLGEAYGETKRAVLDKLERMHPSAHEIRIRSAEAMAAAESRDERPVPQQKPSVGRVVHYVAYGTPGGEFPSGVCRAATITEVGIPLGDKSQSDPDERCSIFVMNPSGVFFNQGIRHDEGKAPGTWHWPERV